MIYSFEIQALGSNKLCLLVSVTAEDHSLVSKAVVVG